MPDASPTVGPDRANVSDTGALKLTLRQAEIVDAASEVFAEHGYAGASMREIANRVGVTEPALYRHFPGKQALFITMVRVVGTQARREGLALIDSMTAENIRPTLLLGLADRRRAIRTFAPVLRAAANAAVSEPSVRDEFRAVIAEPLLSRMAEKAAELDAAFGLPPDSDASREARVRAFFALLVGTMVTSFVLGDSPDEAAVDAALCIMRWA